MSDFKFKYSAKEINELIKEYNLSPAIMEGVHKDLETLKPIIEEIYDKYIFYLSYWKCDCPFFGWDLSDDKVKNMATITDEISHKFLEIYALILSGLGEEMDKYI